MHDEAKDKSHLVLVNAVVFKGNLVLVSQRSWEEPHEPGKWTIPGGKVERMEKETFHILEATVKREVLEETGVTVKDEIKLITNNSFIRSTGQHTIALVFACNYDQGEPQPLEDTIGCRWVSQNELKDIDFAPNVRDYILGAFQNKK